MTLWEWLSRWRATRGYGVHSPLAFRLIKNVVRPASGVAYYGEAKLSPLASGPKEVKLAKSLLRFTAQMQPAFVWTTPEVPDIYIEAIRLAGCVVRIFDGEIFPDKINTADMIVICGLPSKNRHMRKRQKGQKTQGTPGKRELSRLMEDERSLFAFNMPVKEIENLAKCVKKGVVLESPDSMMAVGRKEGEAHRYRILSL